MTHPLFLHLSLIGSCYILKTRHPLKHLHRNELSEMVSHLRCLFSTCSSVPHRHLLRIGPFLARLALPPDAFKETSQYPRQVQLLLPCSLLLLTLLSLFTTSDFTHAFTPCFPGLPPELTASEQCIFGWGRYHLLQAITLISPKGTFLHPSPSTRQMQWARVFCLHQWARLEKFGLFRQLTRNCLVVPTSFDHHRSRESQCSFAFLPPQL